MVSLRARLLVAAVGASSVIACGGSGDKCPVTAANCNTPSNPTTPNTPTASTVIVRAAVDSVGAVGASLQLSAEARSSSGTVVSGAAITWTSSASTASVSGSGLVTFTAAGTVTITATSGSASGTIVMRGVPADVAGIRALLGDAYVASLTAALSAAPRNSVTTASGACTAALASGGLTGVRDCLASLLNVSAAGQPTDAAILNTLTLFWQHAQRLLRFNS